jgi:hypothetical protein
MASQGNNIPAEFGLWDLWDGTAAFNVTIFAVSAYPGPSTVTFAAWELAGQQ